MSTSEFPVISSPALLSERLVVLRRLAAERGYPFWKESASSYFNGLMFRDGDDIVVSSVMDASRKAAPFLAGNITGRFGPEKKQVTTAFVAIPLARPMPSIVLVNAREGALREAQIGMGSRQMLSLAGDFDRSFTLYCPIGHSAQALAVFTPELMELFLDAAPGSDVELVDEWMFIYVRSGKFEPEDAVNRVERVAARVHETIVGHGHGSVFERPEASESRRFAPFVAGVQVLAIAAFGVLVTAVIMLTGSR